MDDLVKRQAVLDAFENEGADIYQEWAGEYVEHGFSYAATQKIIASVPAAIKTGARKPHFQTWCNSDGEPVVTHRVGWECPFCGDPDVKNFCPNCGARILPEEAAE